MESLPGAKSDSLDIVVTQWITRAKDHTILVIEQNNILFAQRPPTAI